MSIYMSQTPSGHVDYDDITSTHYIQQKSQRDVDDICHISFMVG